MILRCLNTYFKSLLTPGLNQRSFSPTNVRWMNPRMWMCTYPTHMLSLRRKEWIRGSTRTLRSIPPPTWMTWPRCRITWAASTARTVTAGKPSMPEAGWPASSHASFFSFSTPGAAAVRMSVGNLSLAVCSGFHLFLRISKACCGTKLAAQILLERTFSGTTWEQCQTVLFTNL